MTPRHRLEFERTAHRWTEAERQQMSDRMSAHLARMNARDDRRGAWVLAVLLALVALPLVVL
jgi:ferric-dicitrate binding protein FerR (iron transport regulator)